MQFVVVYDACVLYPAPLRDFLLHLAVSGLFSAKWSDRIQDEWVGNLLVDRPDLKSNLARTVQLMNTAVPDCIVQDYQAIEAALDLPDPNDNHVLAAAIRSGAQTIVTFNLKDFPEEKLLPYGIEAQNPDVFIEHQLSLHLGLVLSVAKKHRNALKNPAKSPSQYLDTLSAQGLVVTADILREYESVI